MLLMTPGPTRVPERVLAAGARPMLHHRSPEFSAELADMLAMLRPLFGTREPVLPVHATGRGAMEATLCNLFSAGDAIAVCANGRFGEMWAHAGRIARTASCTAWRRTGTRTSIRRRWIAVLQAHPSIRAVAMAYSDTSTGVANDVAGVARVARARGVLTLVDGVSSIGGMPFAFDEWGVDAAVTASQKCLMSSPGLSFVVLSARARSAAATARLPHRYWDLAEIRARGHEGETGNARHAAGAHRPAGGRSAAHDSRRGPGRRVRSATPRWRTWWRAGVSALGLAPQCPALRRRATTVTAIALPPACRRSACATASRRVAS